MRSMAQPIFISHMKRHYLVTLMTFLLYVVYSVCMFITFPSPFHLLCIHKACETAQQLSQWHLTNPLSTTTAILNTSNFQLWRSFSVTNKTNQTKQNQVNSTPSKSHHLLLKELCIYMFGSSHSQRQVSHPSTHREIIEE